MPRTVIDEFLDGLKQAAVEFATGFVEQRIKPPHERQPRAPRIKIPKAKKAKAVKQPKVERKGPTLYDDLEVSPYASAETIRAAYLSLSKRYHPDVSKHKGAAERMKQLNSAWDVLGDEKKRIAYNREIGLRQ